MGWLNKKGKKTTRGGMVPRIKLEMPFPEVPEGYRGVDFLIIGRWTNEAGDDLITSNIYSEEPQENEIDQYEIALGTAHVAVARMNQLLFKLRNPSGVLPTPESDPSQFPQPEAEDDWEWPAEREKKHDLMRDAEYVSKPLHDHPCSDDTCTECYQVTKKMNKMNQSGPKETKREGF